MYEIKSGATFNPDFVKNIKYYAKEGETGSVIYQGDSSFYFKNASIIQPEKSLASVWELC